MTLKGTSSDVLQTLVYILLFSYSNRVKLGPMYWSEFRFQTVRWMSSMTGLAVLATTMQW